MKKNIVVLTIFAAFQVFGQSGVHNPPSERDVERLGLIQRVVVNGVTNTPTAGTVNIGYAGDSTNDVFTYTATANGTNYVIVQWFDATNNVFKFTKTAR